MSPFLSPISRRGIRLWTVTDAIKYKFSAEFIDRAVRHTSGIIEQKTTKSITNTLDFLVAFTSG